ncbi:CRISPR-associated protein, Cas1 family [Butyrivibrio fibrisolvens 16/4]|nr:CRISPR-associated protein, Cas1 family [Butyrivibrio fibrisolvens 16/4]
MAFRVVLIESECVVHQKLNNLLIDKGEGDIWIPLDDISMIVLDNLKIEVTVRLMSTLAEHNIGVIVCNMEHLPIGFYSSYDNHSRISKCIGFQIEKDQQFYDSFWKEVIFYKIKNQRQVLKELKKDDVDDKLNELMEKLTDGDKTNREAHAAKIYFNTLMDTTFSRGNEDILLNSGLDYGYTIVRSYFARLCVGYGLNSQLGIHHKNEFNRFNLVDDLMEPVRPFVDLYAYRILENEKYFKVDHRRKLVNILNHKVRYMDKNMFLGNMIEEYIVQYAAFLSGKREYVVFPEICNYLGEEDDN